MATFEWIIVLLLGAALLATLARRVGTPYPTFLAIGGALLAFVGAVVLLPLVTNPRMV